MITYFSFIYRKYNLNKMKKMFDFEKKEKNMEK